MDSYLAKKFIQISLASYFLLNFFVNKTKEKIQFLVNYKWLNKIIKKNNYLIFLIEKILA